MRDLTTQIEHVRHELHRTRSEMYGISPKVSLHKKLEARADKLQGELEELMRVRLLRKA